MKYFILLLPFLLLSCGTDSDVEDAETETVQIGSFNVVTNLDTGEKHADWVGSPSKMKSVDSDTTWYQSPDGHAITFKKNGNSISFNFRDSTFTSAEKEFLSNHDMSTPFIDPWFGWAFRFEGDYTEAVTSIDFDCEEEYNFSENEAIEFSYTYNESQEYVHLFVVNGMLDSMEHVMGCHK